MPWKDYPGYRNLNKAACRSSSPEGRNYKPKLRAANPARRRSRPASSMPTRLAYSARRPYGKCWWSIVILPLLAPATDHERRSRRIAPDVEQVLAVVRFAMIEFVRRKQPVRPTLRLRGQFFGRSQRRNLNARLTALCAASMSADCAKQFAASARKTALQSLIARTRLVVLVIVGEFRIGPMHC